MPSDWNLFLDSILEHSLPLQPTRLYIAIARETLGYNTRERGVGQRLLRDAAQLDGRSFERARQILIDVPLIALRPGLGGRGNRDLYHMLLDQLPAELRGFTDEPATPSEAAADVETPAETPASTPAGRRVRIEDGGRDIPKYLNEGTAPAAQSASRRAADLPPDSILVEVLGHDVVEDVRRQRFTPEVEQTVLLQKWRAAVASNTRAG